MRIRCEEIFDMKQQDDTKFSVQRAVDGVAIVVMLSAMTLACALPFAQTAFGATPARVSCGDLMSAYLDAHRAAAFSMDDARRMGGIDSTWRSQSRPAACPAAQS